MRRVPDWLGLVGFQIWPVSLLPQRRVGVARRVLQPLPFAAVDFTRPVLILPFKVFFSGRGQFNQGRAQVCCAGWEVIPPCLFVAIVPRFPGVSRVMSNSNYKSI